MAINDHFVVTLQGRNILSGGEASDNVFVYEQIAGTGGAADLATAFADSVYGDIVNILSTSWNFVACDVVNLENPVDFANFTTAVNGQRSGETLPPFVAAAFRYRRTSRSFNNGGKRFGPISENDIAGGIPTSEYHDLLVTLADTLGANIVDSATASQWKPAIWRRPGTYVSGVVPAPGLFNLINDVDFIAISTQNTRKFGRGS